MGSTPKAYDSLASDSGSTGTVRFEMRRESDGLLLGGLDDVPLDAVRAHSAYCRTMLDSSFRDAREAYRTGTVAINLPDRSALCTIAEKDPEGAVRLVRWIIYVLVHEDSGLCFVHNDPALLDMADRRGRGARDMAQSKVQFLVDRVSNAKGFVCSADCSTPADKHAFPWVHFLAYDRTRSGDSDIWGGLLDKSHFVGYGPRQFFTICINAISINQLIAVWDVFVFLDAMFCIARHAVTLRALLSRMWHQYTVVRGMTGMFAPPDPYVMLDLYACQLSSGVHARFDPRDAEQEHAHNLYARRVCASGMPHVDKEPTKDYLTHIDGDDIDAIDPANAVPRDGEERDPLLAAPRHLPDMRHTLFDVDRIWHRTCAGSSDGHLQNHAGSSAKDCGACDTHSATMNAYAAYGWRVVEAADKVRTTHSHRCLLANAQPGLLSTVVATIMRDWYQPLTAASPFLASPTAFGFCNVLDSAAPARFLVAVDATPDNRDESDGAPPSASEMPCFVGDHDLFCSSLEHDFGQVWTAVQQCLVECGANIVLAGGSVVNAMQAPFLRHHTPSSDLDLWVVGGSETARRGAFDHAVAILFDALSIERGWMARIQGSVVTFHNNSGYGDGSKDGHHGPTTVATVQLIYTDSINAVQVIGNFDLSHACAFYDPKRRAVWASWACALAMVTRTTEPLTGAHLKSERLDKARRKGFEPIVPSMPADGMTESEPTTKHYQEHDEHVLEQEIAQLVESAHSHCGVGNLHAMPQWKRWLHDRAMWPVIHRALYCDLHNHYPEDRPVLVQDPLVQQEVIVPITRDEEKGDQHVQVHDTTLNGPSAPAQGEFVAKRRRVHQKGAQSCAAFGSLDGYESAPSVCAAFTYRPIRTGRAWPRNDHRSATESSLAVDTRGSSLAFHPLPNVSTLGEGGIKRKSSSDLSTAAEQTMPADVPLEDEQEEVEGLRRHTTFEVQDTPKGKKIRVTLLYPEKVARAALPFMRMISRPSCEACNTLFRCGQNRDTWRCTACKAIQDRIPFARHVTLHASMAIYPTDGALSVRDRRIQREKQAHEFMAQLRGVQESLHQMTLSFVDKTAPSAAATGDRSTGERHLVSWKTPMTDTVYRWRDCLSKGTIRAACYSWTLVRDAVTGRDIDMADVQEGAFLTGHIAADRVTLRRGGSKKTKATSRFVASGLVAYPPSLQQIVGALHVALSQHSVL